MAWTVVNSGLTNSNVLSFAVCPMGAAGMNIFAGTSVGGGVFLSTNNGISWSLTKEFGGEVRSLVACTTGTDSVDLLAGILFSGGGIYRSSDMGQSWTQFDSGLTSRYIFSFAIESLGTNGTNIFASTGVGVFRSTNDGTSWSAVNNGLTNTAVNPLAVIGSNIFVGTFGGVFKSSNNGSNWTAVNTGLKKDTVYCFASSDTNLFAGSCDGVYLSTNSGTNWKAVNAGLISPILSLSVFGDNLLAGTNLGVWKRPLSEMITAVKDKQNNLPTSFSLQQNYPDPFNPSTTINYSVPNACLVTIKVYNILRKEVATLVNEQKPAGNYSVQFSANNGYASGTYFYKMQAGTFVETKKFLLLK
jgi:photosystem II stability/assembly factor-like uncharacterized protein